MWRITEYETRNVSHRVMWYVRFTRHYEKCENILLGVETLLFVKRFVSIKIRRKGASDKYIRGECWLGTRLGSE